MSGAQEPSEPFPTGVRLPPGVRLPSLSVADALRATFGQYRRHFGAFVSIMAVLAVPSMLLGELVRAVKPGAPTPPVGNDTDDELMLVALQSASSAIMEVTVIPAASGLFDLVSMAAVVVFAAHCLLGQPASLRDAYRQSLRRFGTMFLGAVLTTIITMVLVVTCVGVLAAPYVFLGLAFATQTFVLERRGPIAGLRRSWALAAGHRWRILCCLLVVGGPPSLVIFGLNELLQRRMDVSFSAFTYTASDILGAAPELQTLWIVDKLLYLLSLLIFVPLGHVLATVLYLDLRAREETYRS